MSMGGNPYETMAAPSGLWDEGCRLWVCTMDMSEDPYETMAVRRRLRGDRCVLWVCTIGMAVDPYKTMAAPIKIKIKMDTRVLQALAHCIRLYGS